MAICEYLDETRKERPLMPADPYLRAKMRQIVEVFNSGTQPYHTAAIINLVKNEYKGDPEVMCSFFIKKGLKGNIDRVLHWRQRLRKLLNKPEPSTVLGMTLL